MKTNTFLDWEVSLSEELHAVIDEKAKKMVEMGGFIELNAVLWVDEEGVLQLKPTWDCVISINAVEKKITIRPAESFGEI
ncbi:MULTISPECIES: hypothetical protein [Exiguobacterium]|uniref:hypothetical protein n=1 Tax=Exiguobacterium TaxID=33986 RepID=UPI001BE6E504|nr:MULTISPECIES: hypothetical protein [Exiguobacterium]MCT4793127.1 hypothetical protein [Exiguobacterium artemiae]